MNNSFQACTEQCAAAGTACAGATFGFSGGSQQECYLYTRMLASETLAYPVVAAVRTSGPGGASDRRQVLQNGGFDGALSPWSSERTASGSEFTVLNNTATVVMSLAERAAIAGTAVSDSTSLQQEIGEPAGAGIGYSTSLYVTVTSDSQASCQIIIRSGNGGDTYVNIITRSSAYQRTIYGSGITQEAGVPAMLINVDCTGTNDVILALDNVVFWTYESASSGPGCDTSLLANGDFDSELAPWTMSQGGFNSASVSVSDGQAIVRFENAGRDDDPSRLEQSVEIPVDTPYRITAQLVFIVISGSCSVGIANEYETLYFTGQITSSQTLSVPFDGFSDIQASMFALVISCYSPDGETNSVGVDSVALVLNPGAECP